MVHRRKYKKHKPTKHRTIYIPEGFDFHDVDVIKDEKMVRVVFKKKGK